MKTKNGFTIVELLIYTAIFAIVLTVAIDLFFQSTTLATQITENQEVDRNGRAALLEMTQTIRAASDVSFPVLGATGSDLYLNSNAIRYFVNAQGVLQKTDNGQTSDLTSSLVKIENLSFTTRGETGVDTKPTVSISFAVKTNTLVYGQTNYITKTYQTTVQLR